MSVEVIRRQIDDHIKVNMGELFELNVRNQVFRFNFNPATYCDLEQIG